MKKKIAILLSVLSLFTAYLCSKQDSILLIFLYFSATIALVFLGQVVLASGMSEKEKRLNKIKLAELQKIRANFFNGLGMGKESKTLDFFIKKRVFMSLILIGFLIIGYPSIKKEYMVFKYDCKEGIQATGVIHCSSLLPEYYYDRISLSQLLVLFFGAALSITGCTLYFIRRERLNIKHVSDDKGNS